MNLFILNWCIVFGIGLLLVVLFSSWVVLCNCDKGMVIVGQDVGVDYILYDFQIVVLDEQGKELIILCVSWLECQCGDQIINIVILLFEMLDKDGKYWILCVEIGWFSVKGDEMKLCGNVVGDSLVDLGVVLIIFCIDYLDVFLKENCVCIDVWVIMICFGMEQFGVGFEVDLKNNMYYFFSQFKGCYMF